MRHWLPGWSKWRARDNGRAAGIYVSPRSVAVAVGSLRDERYRLDLRADPIDGLEDAPAKVREQSRDLGLAAVDRLPPVKRFFMKQAMGQVGDLPRLLRGETL